ncbi:MAG: dihydrolipoyl dehydrogenase [Spirochaetales bacterium]|nr:dihydrolipoyl dehydrogenase [Spirochaetales bacterium]
MYDLIIIGGGPAGYLSAERAGARGMNVLLFEKQELGGVCLNEGCIPTKTLIHASKLYSHAKDAKQFGVSAEKVDFSLEKAMSWKQEVVNTQIKGVTSQMKRFGVEVIREHAHLIDRNTVEAGGKQYQTKNILVAGGSSAVVPPIPGADMPHVCTNREILQIDKLPKEIVIVGGGVIGMEFAAMFHRLGVKVSVVEMLDEILSNFDEDAAVELRKAMKGVDFHLGSKVTAITEKKVKIEVNGETKELSADTVLLSVGRKPNTNELGLEAAGVDSEKGWIKVDEQMKTNIPGIYAAGDVTGKSLLAHSAYRMGEVAVNTIEGKQDRMRYFAVPWVVYTDPEVSGCGMTEKQAEESNRTVKTAKIPMRINGRYLAEHGKRAPGFCKVITDAESGVLLGVHMVGTGSSEIIAGAAGMIESELRVQDIKEIIFPHPTLSEVIRDAVWEIE